MIFYDAQVETMMTSLLPNMPDHGTSVASIIFSAFDEVRGEKIIFIPFSFLSLCFLYMYFVVC